MSFVPVPGGRAAEQIIRYLAQVVAASGSDVTDFNKMSVLRTIAEIQAVLGERFEEQLYSSLAEGINRATYRSFGFPVLAASRAYGEVVFTRPSGATAFTIPRNTVVSVPNSSRLFSTYEDLVFGIGILTGTGRILAADVGSAWNTNANTITSIVSSTATGFFVTNPKDITSGRDEETDDQRRVRFADYINNIHRATADSIEYGARTAALYDNYGVPTEFVYSAQVIDDTIPGTAKCFVWNGNQDPLLDAISTDLLALTRKVITGYTNESGQKIPGYKAAGAAVTVVPATITAVPVSVAVYPANGWTLLMVNQAVDEAIRRTFSQFKIGEGVLRVSDLRNAVGGVRGVVDHAFGLPANLVNPTAAPSLSLQLNTNGIANPTTAPTLSGTGSGSPLAAGVYTVAYAHINATGTTKISNTNTVTLTSGQNIDVTFPAPPGGATATVVYVSQAAGNTTLKLKASVAAPGTTYSVTSLPSGALIPSENTTAPGLPAGVYNVSYSWKTSGGQTVASPTAQLTSTGSQSLRVAVLTPPVGASGVNYFISTQPGNLNPLAFAATGTGAQIDLAALPTDATYTAPVANTSGNIAASDGVILVPGTITITEGV